MKNILLPAFIIVSGAMAFTGCGSKEAEKKRARLEIEEKARHDQETANRAITEMNRRMFGKKETAPPTSKTEDKLFKP